MIRRINDEEKEWIADRTKSYGFLSESIVHENGIIEEFEKKFKRKVSQWTLTHWSKKFSSPVTIKTLKKQLQIVRSTVKVLENAHVILYVFPDTVIGFSNKDQVRKYLEDNKPDEPFRIFMNIPAKIQRTVKVIMP